MASALGTVFLVAVRAHRGQQGGAGGAALFGLSLVALYSASSIYHGAVRGGQAAAAAQAGPCHDLCADRGQLHPAVHPVHDPGQAAAVLGALWVLAALGIVFKLAWLDAPGGSGTVLYLALGWAIVVDLPAFAAMPARCLALVAAGACAIRRAR